MTMRNPGHCSQSRTYPPLAHRAATVRGTWLRGQGADKSGCGYNGTLRKLRWACPLDFGAKTNRTLKEQIIHGRIYRNIAELRDAVRDFVELYNAQWIVEKNGYLSPAQARQAWHAAISIRPAA